MSDPVIMLVLLVVLLGLLSLGVWVAIALLSVGTVALVFFSNAPVGQVLATTLWGASLEVFRGGCCTSTLSAARSSPLYRVHPPQPPPPSEKCLFPN